MAQPEKNKPATDDSESDDSAEESVEETEKEMSDSILEAEASEDEQEVGSAVKSISGKESEKGEVEITTEEVIENTQSEVESNAESDADQEILEQEEELEITSATDALADGSKNNIELVKSEKVTLEEIQNEDDELSLVGKDVENKEKSNIKLVESNEESIPKEEKITASCDCLDFDESEMMYSEASDFEETSTGDEAQSDDDDLRTGTQISDEESIDERDDGPLENLTLAQLETLLNKKLREHRKSKAKMADLLMRKEWQELKKKRTIREDEILIETIRTLNEEEAYFEHLTKRISCIKKFMKNPEKNRGAERFDPSKIPQVILCSPWDDNQMPKVVVCSTPREGKMDGLTKEFLKVLSPEQLSIIEKEKQWMVLECGKIRLQIAGIKGKVRVVTKENNVLKTLIDTTSLGEKSHVKVIMPDTAKTPCYGTEGLPGKAYPCPKYVPSQKGEIPMRIDLCSAPATNRRSVGEEIRYIERIINQLRENLDKAILERQMLAEQKRNLRIKRSTPQSCCTQNIVKGSGKSSGSHSSSIKINSTEATKGSLSSMGSFLANSDSYRSTGK